MASTDVEYSSNPNQKGKLASCAEFIYNPSTGEFMGRSGKSWAKITAFYVVYYIALSAFWAGMWFIFDHQLDDNMPQQTGLNSLIKGNPGMGFRPMPDIVSTLIRFKQGKPDSYKIYTDHIQAYLDQYENEKQGGENYMNCQTGKTEDQKEKVCRFNIDDLGNECTRKKDFGYDEGKPCVLLKLNKVFGWEPEVFDNSSKPAIMGDRFSDYHIGITCEGENYADKENIGKVSYYPNNGFPVTFYPYLNQEGYRAPLVMVQFEAPANGILVQVWCKAWAKNIYHHKNDRAGSVHFELLVD